MSAKKDRPVQRAVPKAVDDAGASLAASANNTEPTPPPHELSGWLRIAVARTLAVMPPGSPDRVAVLPLIDAHMSDPPRCDRCAAETSDDKVTLLFHRPRPRLLLFATLCPDCAVREVSR